MTWLCPKQSTPGAAKMASPMVHASSSQQQAQAAARWPLHRYLLITTQIVTHTSLVGLGLAMPTPVLSSQLRPPGSCPIHNAAANVGQPARPTVGQNSGQNSGQTGNVMVLGRSQSRRYVVVVPTDQTALDDKTMLLTVRQCVPQAFISSSGQGLFIYAGAYAKRGMAEGVAATLRSRGLDARVVYFR